LPLVPQMKSKKNGTKENVGKWFYFWMKIKLKKKDIITQWMFFFNFFFVLFCYYFLNKAIKLLKFKKCEILLEEYSLQVICHCLKVICPILRVCCTS
jgi:hypothetical protein